jgi:hypothetical protein
MPDNPIEKQRMHEVLDVPQKLRGQTGETPLYYNDASRLIVLEGPIGPLLARYQGQEHPDPDKHSFLCSYTKPYTPFENAGAAGGPPSRAPADVTAMAMPVLTQSQQKSVVSGETGSPIESDGEQKPSKTITPGSGADNTTVDQPGIEMTPTRMDMRVPKSGITMDEEGIHIKGDVKQEHTKRKGAGRESPIFGLLPKTFVTFFSSDYLPDIQLIMKIQKYVQIILRMPDLYRGIARFANELGGDVPDGDRRDVDLPNSVEDVT